MPKEKFRVLDLQQRKYNLEQSGLAVHEHLGRRDEPAVCNNEAISRFHLPSQSACLVRAHFPRPGKKRSARHISYFTQRKRRGEQGAGHLLGGQELNQGALARHQIVSAAKKVKLDKP